MDIPAVVEQTIEQFCKESEFGKSPENILAVIALDMAARETANTLLKAL